MIKTVLVTNIPAPYREKLHELIAERFQHNYTVIYCAEKEADRTWKFNLGNYKKIGTTNKNIQIFYKFSQVAECIGKGRIS